MIFPFFFKIKTKLLRQEAVCGTILKVSDVCQMCSGEEACANRNLDAMKNSRKGLKALEESSSWIKENLVFHNLALRWRNRRREIPTTKLLLAGGKRLIATVLVISWSSAFVLAPIYIVYRKTKHFAADPISTSVSSSAFKVEWFFLGVIISMRPRGCCFLFTSVNQEPLEATVIPFKTRFQWVAAGTFLQRNKHSRRHQRNDPGLLYDLQRPCFIISTIPSRYHGISSLQQTSVAP